MNHLQAAARCGRSTPRRPTAFRSLVPTTAGRATSRNSDDLFPLSGPRCFSLCTISRALVSTTAFLRNMLKYPYWRGNFYRRDPLVDAAEPARPDGVRNTVHFAFRHSYPSGQPLAATLRSSLRQSHHPLVVIITTLRFDSPRAHAPWPRFETTATPSCLMFAEPSRLAGQPFLTCSRRAKRAAPLQLADPTTMSRGR